MAGAREKAAEGGAVGVPSLAARFRGLAVRVVSAVVLVLVMVILLWWGEIPFTAGISLIVLGGLWELYSTFSRHRYRPATLLSIAAGCALPVMAFFLREGQDLTLLVVAMGLYLPLLFAWCIARGGSDSPTTDIAISLMGVALVGFSMAHFVLMLGFDVVAWTAPFAVIVIVWVYDAVAYFGGSAFGRHKMAPRISPGKSWEGAAAGTVAAFVTAYVLHLTLNREWLSVGTAMALAGLACVFGPLGDLSESLVKRELGVKDMSSLIPGHGGVMDRFDSMFFTAVVSYYFLRYLVIKS